MEIINLVIIIKLKNSSLYLYTCLNLTFLISYLIFHHKFLVQQISPKPAQINSVFHGFAASDDWYKKLPPSGVTNKNRFIKTPRNTYPEFKFSARFNKVWLLKVKKIRKKCPSNSHIRYFVANSVASHKW